MVEIKNLIPREYQKNIFETCKEKNTLVVLPTGTGKTICALLLAVHRLNLFPNSKIVICSPTKPLCSQHVETFKKHTTIKKIVLLTGAVNPKKRKNLWKIANVIIATPQTIDSDLSKKRISLKDVSMLCIDEAHRSKMRYASTIITNKYFEESENPRILALTASPGNEKQAIDEICENLKIESVEIRTEEDKDTKQYIKEKKFEWINIELPKSFIEVRDLIKKEYQFTLNNIKKTGFTKPVNLITKKDLLLLQSNLRKQLFKNKLAFFGVSLTAQALKLEYALELIETQGINALLEYYNKLKNEDTKAAKKIVENENFKKAMCLLEKIKDKKHPKVSKILSILSQELNENKNSRIIIFANYRKMVNELIDVIKNNLENAKPIELVGQKEGLSQKEQIQRIEEFKEGKYNVLIGTSISEEGLHIADANLAIFYEPVASAIRNIQRKGRVGRIKKGRIINLITKNTRDEAYYWSAKRKESVMRKTLYNMKNVKINC